MSHLALAGETTAHTHHLLHLSQLLLHLHQLLLHHALLAHLAGEALSGKALTALLLREVVELLTVIAAPLLFLTKKFAE